MKKVLALGLALGGCQATSNITTVRDFLTDPKTAEAAAVIKSWNAAFACEVGILANLAGEIESAIDAKLAVQSTTGKIYTVSAIVCESLGGTSTQVQ